MSQLKSMLDEYAQSHQNSFNQKIHKVCVPAIMVSIVGLLWAIPSSYMGEYINWGTILVLSAMVYYFILSKKYFLIMIPVVALMYYINFLLAQTPYLLSVSVVVFIISWAFQFWGHKIEGQKPSFLKDLLFLLIGPLWVVKALFKLED
jgi:uncharacterized membrane protein YGL010W